jgi:hypothetical protein
MNKTTSKMKFSELETLLYEYNSAMGSPSRMHVIFGCDCGCGGDSYTEESWDEAERNASKTIQKVKNFCRQNNIEYDGVE